VFTWLISSSYAVCKVLFIMLAHNLNLSLSVLNTHYCNILAVSFFGFALKPHCGNFYNSFNLLPRKLESAHISFSHFSFPVSHVDKAISSLREDMIIMGF